MTETVKTKPIKNPSPTEIKNLLTKLSKKYNCTMSIDITYWFYEFSGKYKLAYTLYIADDSLPKQLLRYTSWADLKESITDLLKA